MSSSRHNAFVFSFAMLFIQFSASAQPVPSVFILQAPFLGLPTILFERLAYPETFLLHELFDSHRGCYEMLDYQKKACFEFDHDFHEPILKIVWKGTISGLFVFVFLLITGSYMSGMFFAFCAYFSMVVSTLHSSTRVLLHG